MCPRESLDMEPPVVLVRYFEGELVILDIVAAGKYGILCSA